MFLLDVSWKTLVSSLKGWKLFVFWLLSPGDDSLSEYESWNTSHFWLGNVVWFVSWLRVGGGKAAQPLSLAGAEDVGKWAHPLLRPFLNVKSLSKWLETVLPESYNTKSYLGHIFIVYSLQHAQKDRRKHDLIAYFVLSNKWVCGCWAESIDCGLKVRMTKPF